MGKNALLVSPSFRPVHVDLHTEKNMVEHATIYYDLPGRLVLRRGQPFDLTVTFNEEFDAEQQRLSLVFKSETWLNASEVKIPLDGASQGWSTRRLATDDDRKDRVFFRIDSPADALIGKYSVR